jgi:hypothetical protein
MLDVLQSELVVTSDDIHNDLATAALEDLSATFLASGNAPSRQQWAALTDLMVHYAKAADGTLPPALYLSTLPPGTGKSLTIQSFARTLAADPRYTNVGILIAVNRIEEVQDMATALQSARDRVCIIVAQTTKNASVLALGDHAEADQAQIVISTQASLRCSLQGREFANVSRYWFHGRQRAVVIHDEALAFNRPIVLNGDEIGNLHRAVRRCGGGEAVQALLEWQAALNKADAGTHTVPDLDAVIDFRQLEELAGDRDDTVATVKALAMLSGSTVHLAKDNFSGAAILTHVTEIPDSILPVIVTDASGASGVGAERYRQMSRPHRPVIRLTEAGKTYANLSIRLVNRAASRSTYRDKKADKAKELIDTAVKYIQSVDGKVLIISYGGYMPMRGVAEKSIQDAVNSRLDEAERGRVKHLSWGRHTATNAFSGFAHVLITGLYFVPRLNAHAASGAALDKSMLTDAPEDHPTEQQINDMARSMLKESTLQALLRGQARLNVGGDCGQQEAVIFQSFQSGLTVDEYKLMFPGASVVVDQTLAPEKPLKGKVKQLADIVSDLLGGGMAEVTNEDLSGSLRMAPSDFRKLVKRPDWQEWVQSRGLQPGMLKGRKMGLRVR